MPNANTAAAGLPTHNDRPVRVFVGVKIVPDVARELAALARGLERFPVRLIATTDIHLTLVPPWDEAAVSEATAKLSRVASRFGAFSLTFRHVGYGPEPKRPRLLWAECMATEEIVTLREALLQAFGQSDERPLRPHVTLARIRRNGQMVARKHPIDQELALTQCIESIQLFRSPSPGESGYQVLASCQLGEPPQPNSNPSAAPQCADHR